MRGKLSSEKEADESSSQALDLVKKTNKSVKQISDEVSNVVLGKEDTIEMVMAGILANGNILFEDFPGLAKTLMSNTLADALGCEFKRIQFTPDLLPADITGSYFYDPEKNKFKFRKGPIFCNILLADEINRAPPKTQAALLEAMQENKVTAGGHTHDLDKPFFVLATQNPIEQEGTYPLPEAQLDRFMFHLNVDYPSIEEEVSIVNKTTIGKQEIVNEVFTKESIINFQELTLRVPISENVVTYAVKLASSTRPNEETSDNFVKQWVEWGAGPRASQFLALGAKAKALLDGRPTPSIEDVQLLAPDILRHRVLPNFNAEAEGIKVDDIVEHLIKSIEA